MGKYQNSIAEYNLNKVIKYYKDAINSAQTSQEARGLSQSLEGVLSTYGKSLADVDGLNTNLLNATANNAAAAGKAGGGGQKGSAYDKQIISDLSEEFGIDVKKSGTTKDWLEKAKTDQNVRVLDKSGKDVTNEREGRIKSGDILEVNSKKHGLVKISVGGDGEINGGDDKVLSVGGKAAADGMQTGLNQINNMPQQNQAQAGATAAAAGQTNPIFNPFQMGITDPQQATQVNDNQLALNSMFNESQIKNLIAAILQQSLYNIEQKEYQRYIGTADVA